MIQITVITPISKGEVTNIDIKLAVSYVNGSTLKQTKGEKKGIIIKRQEKDYQSVYYSHYHLLITIQSIFLNTLLCSIYLLLIK